MNFNGKVVLITGASSGIGAATAVHFSKLGAQLALTGRNAENLKTVAEECEQAHKLKPLMVIGDVALESDVENILKSTIDRFGKLDVLVNNAGTFEFGTIEDTNLEQYDRVMDTNMRSIYQLTMLAVTHLIQSKGNIVNISSIAGVRSLPGGIAYSISKAALDQFTRCTALELAPMQVRVNCVNPGVVASNIFLRAGLDEKASKAYIESSKEVHPLGKVGQPEEIAESVAFLASEASSNTTGVILPVDGGRHATCSH